MDELQRKIRVSVKSRVEGRTKFFLVILGSFMELWAKSCELEPSELKFLNEIFNFK